MKYSFVRHIFASRICFSRRNTLFPLQKHSVSLGETLRSSVWAHSKELLFTLLLLITGGLTPCVKAQVTLTTDTDNPVYYLIQSYGNTAFYMRPNGTNVTTLNILTDDMKWFFLDAGTGTEGSETVQYYYICRKNGNNIQYMYFSGPNFVGTGSSQRIWIQLQAKSGSDDNYKFYIAKKNTQDWDAYNILPKGTTKSSSLNKRGTNTLDGNVQVGNGVDDESSCWNFVALNNYA